MSGKKFDDSIRSVSLDNPGDVPSEDLQACMPSPGVTAALVHLIDMSGLPPQAALNTAVAVVCTVLIRSMKPEAHDALVTAIAQTMRSNLAMHAHQQQTGVRMGPAQGRA